MNNIVILASGDGSNLQAIIDACRSGKIDGNVSAVFSNNQRAPALQKAERAQIAGRFINPQDYADRRSFDEVLIENIIPHRPKLIVLAGYMRILTPAFVKHFSGRLINIHPSLLPKYPGLNTHRQVIENRDDEHGSTVHFVTEQLDGGPIILQSRFSVTAHDTTETLERRIKQLEHQIYPVAINWFMQNRLKMLDSQAWLDDKRLPKQDD